MGLKGGDVRQLLIGPVGEVTPVQEADFTFSLGGWEIDAHVGGNGLPYATGKRSSAQVKGSILGDSVNRVLEKLQAAEDQADPVPVQATIASGDVYSGSLFITGKLEQKRDGSIDIDFQGGRLEKI